MKSESRPPAQETGHADTTTDEVITEARRFLDSCTVEPWVLEERSRIEEAKTRRLAWMTVLGLAKETVTP